ncbi:hypothetical protein AQI70_08310 [Streptomyces curacoi]|uniref:Uncharacterized protein n=1 Tax=Streptomyces curacoi TaxID=146536 RepID=A0A117PIB6_9ACTN|nr:hypothetical protein AQI70_08310 [Streptomyces curacoi]
MKALGDQVLEGDLTDSDINSLLPEADSALRTAWGSMHKVQLEGPELVSTGPITSSGPSVTCLAS